MEYEEHTDPSLPEVVTDQRAAAPAYRITGLPLQPVHVPALRKTYDLGSLTATDVDELTGINWPYIERA